MPTKIKRKHNKRGGAFPLVAALPLLGSAAYMGIFANIFRHNEKKIKRRDRQIAAANRKR